MKFWRKQLLIILTLILGLISLQVFAEGIKLRQIQFEPAESNWVLNASYQIDLPSELGDAVRKGVTFHFLVEFEVTRGRWYWFEERPIQVMKNIRLSYQPLTQQYRINGGGLTISTGTLEEALLQLGSIGGWQVAELLALDNNKTYQGIIRMRLDLSQLPKPFQINALNTREWNLSSEKHVFSFTPHYRLPNSK